MPAQIHVSGAMFPVKKLLAELLADITKASALNNHKLRILCWCNASLMHTNFNT